MPSHDNSGFHILNEGEANGPILRLSAPLNIWGGLDPATGKVVDQRHPQYGECIAGRVLLTPPTVGSGTNAQIFAQACASGTGPAAIVLFGQDLVVAVGAAVVKRIYGLECPVVAGPDRQWDKDGPVSLHVYARNGEVSVAAIF